MKAALLSIHVLAAVILIGPITVAASLFPRYSRAAAREADPTAAPARAVAAAMHRISRSYALPAIAVPVFGIALGAAMEVLTQYWLLIAMGLTVVAAVLLVARILPDQRAVMGSFEADVPAAVGIDHRLRSLAMTTGAFATIWAVVVVLMIVRPGSSTGV